MDQARVGHNLKQSLDTLHGEDMTANGEVRDAERFVCSAMKQLANETHLHKILTVDMLGDLTENLGW